MPYELKPRDIERRFFTCEADLKTTEKSIGL